MKTRIKDLTEYLKVRALIVSTREEICDRLGYTHEDLSTMTYEQGVIFLEEFHKDAPLMARLMEQDKVFWNWWKNQWHIRNEEFLRDTEMPHCSIAFQRLCYEGYNNGKDLTKLIRPTRIVYLKHLKTFKTHLHAFDSY